MLNFASGNSRNCEGVSRRSFLQIGALGLGGLTLPNLLQLRAAEAAAGRQTGDAAVILLWLDGGPSQFETYDPKPDAPAEYRGEFRPIRTRVPGMNICELLPRHAQIADKLTIIRSVAHRESGHGSAVKNLNTGYPHPPGTNEGTFLYPAVGAIVAKAREEQSAAVCRTMFASRPWASSRGTRAAARTLAAPMTRSPPVRAMVRPRCCRPSS
jgi:hypothetical protein